MRCWKAVFFLFQADDGIRDAHWCLEFRRVRFRSWAAYDDASRQAQAKRVVDAWKAGGREIGPLRIAVPDSPGGRILYAYVAADFDRIGVPSRRVGMDAAADLKLIDEVTPNDDPLWGLRQIGRAHVCTPVTNAHIVCRLLLEKKKDNQ